jgi:hypothetical protein
MSKDLCVAHHCDRCREDDAAENQEKRYQHHWLAKRSGSPAFAHQCQHQR